MGIVLKRNLLIAQELLDSFALWKLIFVIIEEFIISRVYSHALFPIKVLMLEFLFLRFILMVVDSGLEKLTCVKEH